MTMAFNMLTFSLLMLVFLPGMASFGPSPYSFRPFSLLAALAMSSSDSADDELERKMALVRSLQSVYYQSSSSEPTVLEKTTGIMRNLPLWRVQWTELPGRSNVLNVHEGQYTNMFETIIRGPKPWYVGHLFLPGGSKNIKSDERRFQLKTWNEEVDDEAREEESERSAVVGTLLRISDFRRLQDGRLILLVQALERFVVVNCIQSVPYSIADVQILPDFDESPATTEEEAQTARAKQVMASFQYHNYEYEADFKLPLAANKYLSATDIWGPDIAKVLPFVPYSKPLNPSELQPVNAVDAVKSEDFVSLDNESSMESRLIEGGVLSSPTFLSDSGADLSVDTLEDRLWRALEDFCLASQIELPNEVLCLLPPTRPWPTRVERVSVDYPPERRQRRLSFAASAFLEQTRVGADLRLVWLETPGTRERLRYVLSYRCVACFLSHEEVVDFALLSLVPCWTASTQLITSFTGEYNKGL
jgi:Lon protease-like protein